jgi:hypothetical protein
MSICNCPTIINTATARSQGNKSGGCAQQLGRQRKAFAYRKKTEKPEDLEGDETQKIVFKEKELKKGRRKEKGNKPDKMHHHP